MYKEKIVDGETGEITWRNYTPEEVAEVEKAQAEAAQFIAEQAERAAQRAVILERLGLTEDEAKLILG